MESDADLIQGVRGQDSRAFDTLLDRHGRCVRLHLERIVRDPGVAADLAQEVFLRLWTRAEQWTGSGSLSGWLLRIASMRDFTDPAIGPQLLAIRSGARGGVAQVARLVGPLGPVVGADGQPLIIRHSLAGELAPAESYALAAAMRQRLWQLHQDLDQAARTACQASRSKGFNVLARAARSEYPGVVFVQAAASGQVDPLTDLDARLFVGLPPA